MRAADFAAWGCSGLCAERESTYRRIACVSYKQKSPCSIEGIRPKGCRRRYSEVRADPNGMTAKRYGTCFSSKPSRALRTYGLPGMPWTTMPLMESLPHGHRDSADG